MIKIAQKLGDYDSKFIYKTTENFITGKVTKIIGFTTKNDKPTNTTMYYVPKFYWKHFNVSKPVIPCYYNDINYRCDIKLRPNQVNIYNTMLQRMEEDNGCVLSVPCGTGKTILGIKLIADLRKKTLILVHKDFLMNQWKDSIEEFLHITPGIVKQKTRDFEPNIVIASIQTIMKHPEIKLTFDFVIVDECHHIASKEFSEVLKRLKLSKYTLGLSATPKREDHCEQFFFDFLGPLLTFDQKRGTVTVIPIMLNPDETNSNSVNTFTTKTKTVFGKTLLDTVGIITDLSRDRGRIQVLIHMLKNMDISKQCIVLADRVELLQTLSAVLTHEKIQFAKCFSSFRTYTASNNHIVLATYAMASEGLNIVDLDTLILATPVSSSTKITQSIGRIQRKACNDSTLYDLVDKPLYNMFQRRKRIYSELNAVIDTKICITCSIVPVVTYTESCDLQTFFGMNVKTCQKKSNTAKSQCKTKSKQSKDCNDDDCLHVPRSCLFK